MELLKVKPGGIYSDQRGLNV